MLPDKIGFAGLGLIGGTLAKTIHRLHPDITLIAYDIDQSAISQALAEGVIQYGYPELCDDFSSCQYIFLCAPVNRNKEMLPALASYVSDHCILTDVGSVKSSMHREISSAGLAPYFIGGHPMAGSEKSSYAHATPYLLENAYYILTPSQEISKEKVLEFEEFIRSLGAIPMVLDYETHDYATAAISHLPHILASTLVNLVEQLDNEQELMKTIAAGGFKDITRIASSSPVMWEQICLANQQQILKLIDSYTEALLGIREEIASKSSNEIFHFFQKAKDYRDSISVTNSGSLLKVYELYCDLVDETGGIATLATILATNQISIKNIGILHNREFQDGVLHVEFYDDEALKRAIQLLRRHHYSVYER